MTRAQKHVAPVPQESVERVLGHAHLISTFDGQSERILKCHSCGLDLPDDAFQVLGPRLYKTKTRPLTGLHPYCRSCRTKAREKCREHPLYSERLVSHFSQYEGLVRNNASSRSIYFGLDYHDFLARYLEQNGRCALTGLEMEPFREGGHKVKSGRNIAAPSLDRIDSKGHYTPDNIQFLLWGVNAMKGELPQNVFIELCHQISVKNLL